mmetsp:Transcript_22541/g.63602  ORF Transcript_22541/g.63602 Transcript_22541/m.63602 type:complete len:298 (-) Transcript_22541:405-1298(-)
MHARSWFSVCSNSSFALPTAKFDSRRLRPSASISSMNTTHGAIFPALSKSCLTRAAPRPTNISTNSEPEQEMKGRSAACASARANSVLPVPGGPTNNTPRGGRAPTARYRFADSCDDNATSSATSRFAASMPATLSKVTTSLSTRGSCFRLLPTLPMPPPVICLATRPSAVKYPIAINQTTADAGDARGRARLHSTPLRSIFDAKDPGTSAGTVYLRMPFIKKSYLEEDTRTSLIAPFRSIDRKNWLHGTSSTASNSALLRADAARAFRVNTAKSKMAAKLHTFLPRSVRAKARALR